MQYNNPYFQQPYQPQYNPIQPQYDRFGQYQGQYNQPQIYAQAQPTGLNGEVVDSIDVVKAKNVDMSGHVSFYPKSDMTEIYTKQLQADGTSRIVTYRAVTPEVNKSAEQQTVNLDTLNGLFIQLKMDLLHTIGGELENIKSMLPASAKSETPKSQRGGAAK